MSYCQPSVQDVGLLAIVCFVIQPMQIVAEDVLTLNEQFADKPTSCQ